MKIKIALIFLCSVIAMTSCNKPETDDLSGIEDSYTGQPKKILAKQEIFIRRQSSDSSFFLYSVKSDDKGFFQFTNLISGEPYVISSIITSASSTFPAVFFYNAQNVTSNSKNVELILSPNNNKQNGFYIQVKDNVGQILPNTKVCIFNNRTLALTDTCNGSIFQLSTNNIGRILYYNISPGKYYLRASFKAGSNIFKASCN
jgi:hypothetical protein